MNKSRSATFFDSFARRDEGNFRDSSKGEVEFPVNWKPFQSSSLSNVESYPESLVHEDVKTMHPFKCSVKLPGDYKIGEQRKYLLEVLVLNEKGRSYFWQTWKSLNEFLELNRRLTSAGFKLCTNPPIQDLLDEKVNLIERLQKYLNSLVESEHLMTSNDLLQFLDNEYSTLLQMVEIQNLKYQIAKFEQSHTESLSHIRKNEKETKKVIQDDHDSINSLRKEEPAFGIGLSDEPALQSSENQLSENGSNFSEVQFGDLDLAVLEHEDQISKNSPLWQVYKHVDTLVDAMKPSLDAIAKYEEITNFVIRVLRSTLGAQAHAVGSVPLSTFISGDPIRMSLFVNTTQENLWFTKINEVFCRISTMRTYEMVEYLGNIEKEDSMGVRFSSRTDFKLGTIAFFPESRVISCIVDGIEVLIAANEIDELCHLGFFEQIDRRIGRNHLFKRSLILIKTWLRSMQEQEQTEKLVSEYLLFVLIVQTFATYSYEISTPFHALCYFLNTYGTLAWDSCIVSVFNIKDIEHKFIDIVTSTPLQAVLTNIIDQYTDKYKRCKKRQQATILERTNFTQGVFPFNFHDNNVNFQYSTINVEDPLDPSWNLAAENSSKEIQAFINIINKSAKSIASLLQHIGVEQLSYVHHGKIRDKNVRETLRKLDKIFSGFQLQGFDNITQSLLQESFKKRNESSYQDGEWADALNSAFKATAAESNNIRKIASFPAKINMGVNCDSVLSLDSLNKEMINPDLNKNLVMPDMYTLDLEKLNSSLLYCSLLLDSEVTAPALLALTSEILKEKGPLPVGEIGKALQESTSNAKIPAILKEKFGGLKRFLEVNHKAFLISQDHPYNPKVYLRSLLTPAEIQVIKEGGSLIPGVSKASGHAQKKKKKKCKGYTTALTQQLGMRNSASMGDLSRLGFDRESVISLAKNSREFIPGQYYHNPAPHP